MRSLGVDGYSIGEVESALHGSSRRVRFRYELLNLRNEPMGWIDKVEHASVANNSLANIRRSARFVVKDDPEIDWVNDRIRPWYELLMPDGGWATWPLGVFLLSTPKRSVRSTHVFRDVEAYDQTLILQDDRVLDRYTVVEATNVIQAVHTVLNEAGIEETDLLPTSEVLPTTRDWPPGTTRAEIISDLLSSINYRSLFFGSGGRAMARPYERPDVRPTEYTYRSDHTSLLHPSVDQQIDMFNIPNAWVAVVSEPDQDPMFSTYVNINSESPTSVVSRGRTIVDYREVEATSQSSLDSLVERLAFESSQVFEIVEFSTAIMPHHEDSDLIEINYPAMSEPRRYVEHTWEMELEAGASMSHRVRRVVLI